MNIAFWSEEDGCGTTSGMAAAASVCANAWNLKVILMQSRTQEGDLWEKLEPAGLPGMVREERSYGALDGMDYLLWQVKNQKLNAEMVLDSMIPVVKERMYYLPQGTCGEPHACLQQLKEGMRQIIRQAEQISDLTFIDCGNGENELSAFLLSRADAVVVNLSQERHSLDAYFQKRHAFRGKILYLVNRYQPESVYNRKNLNRLYRLKEEELGVIPDNPVFRHACSRGKIDCFVRRHIRCTALDCQHYFMQELMQTAYMILRAAGFTE